MHPNPRAGSWTLLVPLLALAFLTGACQRRPHVDLPPADSTLSYSPDSAVVELRRAQQMWEAGTDLATAAAATAQALQHDLQAVDPADWARRAQFLLDSLGVGGEMASAPCALVLSVFSRSNPDAGSWPFLFSCGAKGVEMQAVEGRDLRVLAAASRGLGGLADSVRGVAVLFARRSAGGPTPLLMTWKPASSARGKWTLLQTLGADSLGGFGGGDFEVLDSGVDLVTRTFRTPAGFMECATCPHTYSVHRFRWGKSGFERIEDREVPSTYSTFVRFIRALSASDQAAAEMLVTDPMWVAEARAMEWDLPKGVWRPAPGGDETPLRLVFYRGQTDAYAVRFQMSGSSWLIAGFERVDRSIE